MAAPRKTLARQITLPLTYRNAPEPPGQGLPRAPHQTKAQNPEAQLAVEQRTGRPGVGNVRG